MLGSIFKYGMVALGGAMLFSLGLHHLDDDAIEMIRKQCDDESLRLNSLGDDIDHKVCMTDFINRHRAEWVSRLTFTNSLKTLDELLAKWL